MARRGCGGAASWGAASRVTTPVLGSSALREGRLLLMQTGSSSPCLDLRYVAPLPPGPPGPLRKSAVPAAAPGRAQAPLPSGPWEEEARGACPRLG